MARRQFASFHAECHVCCFAMFGFTGAKAKPADDAVFWIAPAGSVMKQTSIAQGAQSRILNLDHPDIETKRVVNPADQQRAKATRSVKKKGRQIQLKSSRRISAPACAQFRKRHQAVFSD